MKQLSEEEENFVRINVEQCCPAWLIAKHFGISKARVYAIAKKYRESANARRKSRKRTLEVK